MEVLVHHRRSMFLDTMRVKPPASLPSRLGVNAITTIWVKWSTYVSLDLTGGSRYWYAQILQLGTGAALFLRAGVPLHYFT